MEVTRFTDDGSLVTDFGEEFLVVCPKCSDLAVVTRPPIESEESNKLLTAPRKLTCSNCTYVRGWKSGSILIGADVDWYFRQTLWLQIPCCGKTLWAYNLRHLEYLENYVRAKLRSRIPNRKSVASRLPTWMKKAGNRQEILKAIGKLKATVK